MSINYNRNNYTKIGSFTNVLAEVPKADPLKYPDKPILLCSFMKPLISKLALTHPEWVIVGVEPRWNNSLDVYNVYRFEVFQDSRSMGRIYREGYFADRYRYEIHNERVGKTRQKHGGMKTKDLKKALKAVDEFFAPLDDEELREEAVRKTNDEARTRMWQANRYMNNNMEKLTPAVASYLVRHMNSIRSELESLGASANALEAVGTLLDKCKPFWQIEESRDQRRGTTVVLKGDRYMLIPDTDMNSSTVVTASELDPDMAGKIGILKILNNNDDAVEDVGMRVTDTIFYVMA